MNLQSIANLPGLKVFTEILFGLEGAWFDLSRRVHTAHRIGVKELTLVGDTRGANGYMPVRPSTARSILRDLPIDDPSRYVFVDLGSGKGRMLLIAAEHPFREIQGIEFAAELHREAEANIKRYRSPKQRCRRLRSLALNAADYSFPRGDLVVYLFNSFGRAVMEQVLDRLEKSLEDDPRDVILVMLFPECSFLVDARTRFCLYKQTRRYRIYRSCVNISSAVSDSSKPAAIG